MKEKDLQLLEQHYVPDMSFEEFILACGHDNSPEWVKNRIKARWRTLRNRRYAEVFKEHNTEIRFYVNDSQLRILANEAHKRNMSIPQLSKRTVLNTERQNTTGTDMDVLLRKTLTVLTQASKQTHGVTRELILEQIEALRAELKPEMVR